MSRDTLDHMVAYDLAREMVKKAGFRLHQVSMNSESCYFDHPGRPGVLLRASAHKNKSRIGHSNVVAKVSISPRFHDWTEFSVFCAVRLAIGNYFLKDLKPSEYRGKRGTWETTDGEKHA